MFSNPRYMNGAATNPEVHNFAYACAQTQKTMEINKRLGGENYVFWGGREGYQSTLNTDVKKELDHMATFMQMVVDYKKKIGMEPCQLLIEPKPREPTKHQYDYDAQTVIGFLHTYGLEDHFKVNIEPNHTTLAGHDFEHDIMVAAKYGMLGSVDSNTGDPLVGWDTDQFPMDHRQTAKAMQYIVEAGGLAPGGLNFDCKVRRESTDPEDLFIGHIGAMDTFARGLRMVAAMKEDNILPKMLEERYKSWDTDLGKKIESGKATMEEMTEYVKKNGEPPKVSGKQEKFEQTFNYYA